MYRVERGEGYGTYIIYYFSFCQCFSLFMVMVMQKGGEKENDEVKQKATGDCVAQNALISQITLTFTMQQNYVLKLM